MSKLHLKLTFFETYRRFCTLPDRPIAYWLDPSNDDKTFINRCFQVKWLETYKWLEYSVSTDAAFCFPCRFFDLKSAKETSFTESGFSNWRAALSKDKGFKKHESSAAHLRAMQQWQERLNRDMNANPVTELLISSTLQKRRLYMKAVI